MNKEPEKFMVGKGGTIRFNVLIAGEPGCGKSTFLQSFALPYTNKNGSSDVRLLRSATMDCTIHFEENNHDLRNVLLKNHNQYIDNNSKLVTPKEHNALDTRIHCLVCIFGPHRVLDTDRKCLKSVRGLVPIVPVLAKADSLTVSEGQRYLREISDLMAEVDSASDVPTHFQFIGHEETSDDTQDCSASDLSQSSDASTPPISATAVNATSSQDELETGETKQASDSSVMHAEDASASSFEVLSRTNSGDQTETAPTPPRVRVALEPSQPAGTNSEHHAPQAATPSKSRQSRKSRKSTARSHARSAPPLSPTDPADLPAADLTAAYRQDNIFAVVCSANESGLREYPWGCSVSAYDERVPDFRRLQRLVFERGNIARLRDLTQQMTVALHQRREKALQRRRRQDRCKAARAAQEEPGFLATSLVAVAVWCAVASIAYFFATRLI